MDCVKIPSERLHILIEREPVDTTTQLTATHAVG